MECVTIVIAIKKIHSIWVSEHVKIAIITKGLGILRGQVRIVVVKFMPLTYIKYEQVDSP